MRIVLATSTQDAVNTVVTTFIDRISTNSSSVIGLATGKTMLPVYEAWVKQARELEIDHDKSLFFMLDEYVGMNPDDPSSFKSYIDKYLRIPLDLKEDQFVFPTPNYEALIKQSSGIDLQLLGLGTNGHIAFNEPGSSKDSRTRIVELAPETIRVNGIRVDKAMTMGIATILESKSIILLATGESKAETIKYLMNHHDDPKCPVTYLKNHPHFTLVLDPAAASKINLKI